MVYLIDRPGSAQSNIVLANRVFAGPTRITSLCWSCTVLGDGVLAALMNLREEKATHMAPIQISMRDEMPALFARPRKCVEQSLALR